MPDPLAVIAGTDESFSLALKSGGAAFTGCLAGDTFTVTLWAGDGRSPISPAPTAAWVSAPAGTFTVAVPRAATTSLDPGDYPLRVDVVRTASASGLIVPAYVGTLRVIASSGAGAAPLAYNTYEDVLEFYPTAARLQLASDQSGFARAAHTAWGRINAAIVRRVDLAPECARRRGATADRFYGPDVPDRTTAPPTVTRLRAALNLGGIVLDATDAPALARIAADMTLAVVLGSKEAGSRQQNPFSQSSKEFEAMALEALAAFDPYVDMTSPLDGVADIQIVGDHVVYLAGWV